MFGEEGQQRMIKTLKQQVQDRDARYSKLLQQKTAQDEQLKEAKLSAESLRVKADAEEERAERAETALGRTKDDLAQARLNVGNLETQLRAESDRAAASEAEQKRLEYHLQSVSSTSGPGPSTQETKLKARVKALEQDLARKESELARAQQASSANTSTSTPHGRGRRRASSVNGDLSQLATQRDDAAHRADAASKEVEGLKAKLWAAERERDAALNARMALEKRSGKEVEALQDRIDELEFYANAKSGSDGPHKATEKLRSELHAVQAEVEAALRSVEDKDAEIARLQASLLDASSASEAAKDLRGRIASLESELADARARPASADGQANGGNHQRELKAALRRAEAKEREVADLRLDLQEANDENEALRRGGPTSGAVDYELQSQVSALEEQLALFERERDDAVAKSGVLQAQVDESVKELDTLRAELSSERETISTLREQAEEEMTAKVTNAAKLETAIAAAQARIATLEADAISAASEVADAEAALQTAHEALRAAEIAQAELRSSLDDAIARSSDQAERIGELESEVAGSQTLQTQLTSVRNELERWRSTAETYQGDIMEMEEALRGEIDEVEAKLAIVSEDLTRAVSDRAAAAAQVKLLETEIVRSSGSSSSVLLEEKDAKIATLTQQRDELQAKLQEQILLLDRPSESSTPAQNTNESNGKEQTEQIERMTSTILRLRTERDNAKSEAKFADDELTFERRGRSADQGALRDVRAELEEKAALLDVLNSEKAALLDVLNSEKAELEANVAQLETESAARRDAESLLEEKAALVEALKSEKAGLETRIAELEVQARVQANGGAEGLQAAQAELEEKAALVETLTADKTALETKVTDLEAQVAANLDLTVGRDDLSQRLKATESERDDLASRLTSTGGERDDVRSKLSDLETQLSELRTELDTVSQTLGDTEASLATAEDARRAAENRASLQLVAGDEETKRALVEEQERVERRDKHITNLEADKQKLDFNLKSVQGDFEELSETHEALKLRATELESSLEAAVSQEEFEELSGAHEALKGQFADLEAALDAAISSATYDTLSVAHDDLKSQHTDLKAQHAELERSLDSARAGVDEARDQARRSNERLQAMQENLESLHVDLDCLKTSHSRTLAEHKSLKADHEAISLYNAALINQHAELVEEMSSIHNRDDGGDGADETTVNALVLSAVLLRKEAADSAARSGEVTAQLQASTERVAQLEAEIADLEQVRKGLERSKEDLRNAEERISTLEGTVDDLATATKKTAELEVRIGELEREIDTSKNKHRAAICRIAELEDELSASGNVHSQATARVAELEAELAASHASLSAIEEASSDLAFVTQAKIELEARVAELASDLEASDTATAEANARIIELEKDVSASQDALSAAEEDRKRALSEFEAQMDELNTEAEQQISATNDAAAKAKVAHETAMVELERTLSRAKEQAAADLADANDRLRTAEDDVSALSESSNVLQRDLVKARSELSSAGSRAEDAEVELERLQGDVARLESEIASGDDVARAAAKRIETLVAELSETRAEQSAMGADLDAAQADLDATLAEAKGLRTQQEALREQLHEAHAAVDTERAAVQAAEGRAIAAESEARKSASHIHFMERQQADLSARLAALRDDLAASQEAAQGLPGLEAEVARLTSANAAQKAEINDLEEDLRYKIAALDAKNLDIEEADDREIELRKQIKKAGARADKLARKNKALEGEIETLHNTMENMSPRRALPSSTSFALSAPAAPAFAASAGTSSSGPSPRVRSPGSKRSREPEESSTTREAVFVEAEPALKTRTSPGSSNRQPLAQRTNSHPGERPLAGKKMSATERAFMQKRAQMVSTPSERKTLVPSVRNVFAAATTPGGATQGERRNVFAPGRSGGER